MAITFDQKGMHALEARCTQENPSRCQVACPFNLDVRGMLTLLAAGKEREARKCVQRSLPLPGIVSRICDHPCESPCLRAALGGALSVSEVERWLVSALPAPAAGFPVRPKSQRMAILGAGLAGLVCAFDLANKGYAVDLYHTGEPHAALCAAWPDLARAWNEARGPAEEFAALATKVAFRQVERLDTAFLATLSVLSAASDGADETGEPGYSAFFVDASCCTGAPEKGACASATLLWEGQFNNTVTVGGWPDEGQVSASRAGGEGRTAAVTMERLAQHVSLTAARQRERQSPWTQLAGKAPVARVQARAGHYDRDEAVREAGRCLDCKCTLCVDSCAYMQKYQGYPRVFTRMIFNNLSIAQGIRKANPLINSCALCRQCEELCPGSFSMTDLCLAAREELVDQGFMSISAFEFALEDMAQASGEQSLFVHKGQGEGTPAYVFFPGCQLAGCRPEQVEAVYEYLVRSLPGGVGVYLSCCGIPARWAGEKALFAAHVDGMRARLQELGNPTVITACPTCLSVFRDFLPEIRSTSLWEVLDGLDVPNPGAPAEGAPRELPSELIIQDPCSARHNEPWLNAVRSLAGKCGIAIREPERTRATTACCGHGGNQWCADRNASRAMAQLRARQLGGPTLTSCILCRENLAAQGLETWHLLDILPLSSSPVQSTGQRTDQGAGQHAGQDTEQSMADQGSAGKRPASSLSARRAGRRELKRAFVRRLTGVELPSAAPMVRMRYVRPMLAELEARQILQEDVEAVLAYAEARQVYLTDPQTGRRLASWRPRTVTFWVEYSLEKDDQDELDGQDEQGVCLLVHDVWCHRTLVPGAGGEKVNQARSRSTNVPAGAETEKGAWRCASCGKDLVLEDVPTLYAHGGLTLQLWRCPDCGLTLVPRALCEGQMKDMQQRMEETWHGGGQRWMASSSQV